MPSLGSQTEQEVLAPVRHCLALGAEHGGIIQKREHIAARGSARILQPVPEPNSLGTVQGHAGSPLHGSTYPLSQTRDYERVPLALKVQG